MRPRRFAGQTLARQRSSRRRFSCSKRLVQLSRHRASDGRFWRHSSSSAPAQDQRLARIYQRLNQEAASEQIASLQGKFGAQAVHEAAQELAERVKADEAYYLDPTTRDARLQQALGAILYEQQVSYDRGDDIHDSVSAVSLGRDIFGSIRPEYAHPEPDETGPEYERRVANEYRTRKLFGRHPDPEVAAIDAAPSRRLPI